MKSNFEPLVGINWLGATFIYIFDCVRGVHKMNLAAVAMILVVSVVIICWSVSIIMSCVNDIKFWKDVDKCLEQLEELHKEMEELKK